MAAVAAALAPGSLASPAGAHEGEAVVTVEAAHPAGTSVHYIVRVTWANDGHPAADATVTATGLAPDGTPLTPVTMEPVDSDGRYAGAVDYPEAGSWTVRITAIDPTGSVEQSQQVSPPATEPAEGSEVTTAPADEGFAPQDDGTGASQEGAAPDDGDDAGMPVYLIVAAAAVVLIGAVTAVNLIRRTRSVPAASKATDRTPPPGTGADPVSPPSGTGASSTGGPPRADV
jgi:hypothetical protein